MIQSAAAATARVRADTELGVLLALKYLKRFDRAGYLALTDYLKAHPDNPIVADINDAAKTLSESDETAGGVGGEAFSSGGGPPSSPQ